MKTLPLGPNHLPKDTSPDVIIRGIGFQRIYFGGRGHKHSDHSILEKACIMLTGKKKKKKAGLETLPILYSHLREKYL